MTGSIGVAPPATLVVNRWAISTPARLDTAIAGLAGGDAGTPAVVAGVRFRVRAREGTAWSLRAAWVEKGPRRRAPAVDVDLVRWSADTVEVIVHPTARRHLRAWSGRRAGRYLRLADVVADVLVGLLATPREIRGGSEPALRLVAQGR
jgi:hypothetical protein